MIVMLCMPLQVAHPERYQGGLSFRDEWFCDGDKYWSSASPPVGESRGNELLFVLPLFPSLLGYARNMTYLYVV